MSKKNVAQPKRKSNTLNPDPEKTGYRDIIGKFFPKPNATVQEAKIAGAILTLEENYNSLQLMHYHLNEFIRLKLRNTYADDKERWRFLQEGRTFPPIPFVEQTMFIALLNRRIEALEAEGVLRRKRMPDGSIRIYHVSEGFLQCYGTVEQWKQCPESDCVLHLHLERCPHFPDIINQWYNPTPIDDEALGFRIDTKRK